MAFAITNKALNISPDFAAMGQSTQFQYVATATSTAVSSPFHQEFADYTTSGPIPLSSQILATAIGDFQTPHRTFRALISLKQLTGATGPPMIATLECASSTGLSPVLVLDSKSVGGTSTSACFTLFGSTPSNVGMQFARVNFIAATTSAAVSSSTAVDVIIEAA